MLGAVGALASFPNNGRSAVAKAVQAAIARADERAVDCIVEYTQGYPYLVHEYGKIVWDETSASPITLNDAKTAIPLVEPCWTRASSASERNARLTGTALSVSTPELGPESHPASEVARRIHRTAEQSGAIRSRLIDRGLLYTPGHGPAAFTVPQFGEYLLRCQAGLAE